MSMVPTTQDKIDSLKRERDSYKAGYQRVVAERDELRRCVRDYIDGLLTLDVLRSALPNEESR